MSGMFQDPLLLADISDDSDVHGVPEVHVEVAVWVHSMGQHVESVYCQTCNLLIQTVQWKRHKKGKKHKRHRAEQNWERLGLTLHQLYQLGPNLTSEAEEDALSRKVGEQREKPNLGKSEERVTGRIVSRL